MFVENIGISCKFAYKCKKKKRKRPFLSEILHPANVALFFGLHNSGIKVSHNKNEPRREKACFCPMRTTKAQSDQHLCCSLPR